MNFDEFVVGLMVALGVATIIASNFLYPLKVIGWEVSEVFFLITALVGMSYITLTLAKVSMGWWRIGNQDD